MFCKEINFVLCIDWIQTKCVFLAANEEYYQLLMTNDSQHSGLDVSSYTIEEIDSITSEYTLKNNVRNVLLNLANIEVKQLCKKNNNYA